jgi:hypothetical protein
MTAAEFRRGMPLTFGTYCMPTKFIPMRSLEEIAAEERREAAARVRTVLRGSAPGRRSPLAGQPCASCALGPVPRLLPLGFPFPPDLSALTMSARRVNRSASFTGTENSAPGST